MSYPYALPDLSYAYDALVPAIDARTMEIHHSRHHQGYVNKLNTALEAHAELQGETLGSLLGRLPQLPEDVQAAVQNSGGGHFNHTLFWTVISPNGGGAPTGPLADALARDFGSFDAFKEQFAQAAGSVFGSGWAWLVQDNGTLSIAQTGEQDTPLADGQTPILGLDVWEHAYYLNYQNRRADYVASFWDVVNWEQCAAYYEAA
ncbi:MAG: superoxide dismutase [Bacteroidota bacterium]